MFTGIVTAVGTVRRVRHTARALAITIAAPLRGLRVGDSIAVDGACLTVVRTKQGTFTVEAVVTTRGRTTFGTFRAGRSVNLERALRASDRLGGHLVSGHVDAVGVVVRREVQEGAALLDIRANRLVADVAVLHGSVAVDGCSMTINALPRPGVIQVSVIPHTLAVTTLGRARVGTRVHLEADQVAKLVQRFVAPHRAVRRKGHS